MTSPRPRTLTLIAGFGMLLGAFGALSSFATAAPLTETREEFVSMYRETAEKQRAVLIELAGVHATTEELNREAEREGDIYYGRRGSILPMAAVNLILSVLLFAGCGGAFRGAANGVTTWHFAALASIPYHLLDTIVSIVQSNDLRAAITSGTALGDFIAKTIVQRSGLFALKGGLEIAYFLFCLFYLRSAAVKEFVSERQREI